VSSLENRIAELEKGATPAVQTAAASHLSTMPVYQNQHLARDAVDSPRGNDVAEDGESNADAGPGVIALSPNSFLGTSSGFPLAKLLKSAISTSDDPSRIGRSTSKGIISFAPHLTNYETGIQRGPLMSSGKADMPTDEVGRKLIDAYYFRVHPKHPFLSKKKIMRLHNNRANLVPAHKIPPSTENRAELCDYAILHLVYAIGGRYLQLTPDNKHPSPSVSVTTNLWC
jgi:hypothetical protein